jgi:hypothetical protein
MNRYAKIAERIAEDFGKNHQDFETKKEALQFLNNHALMSVGWMENGKHMSAIYWNGKLSIQPADLEKRWAARLTSQGVITWLKNNIRHFPNIDAGDEDAIHGLLIKQGIARDTDEDFEIIRRAMSEIRKEMSWTGGDFKSTVMKLG